MINKKILGTIVLLCIASGFIGYEFPRIATYVHRAPRGYANLLVFAETAHGDYVMNGGNLITDIGERYLRNLAYGNVSGTINGTKYISLSNDATPLATWTELANENASSGFGRAEGTLAAWYRSSDYSFNVTHKFTSGGAATLQCAGLQWNPTAEHNNDLFACAAFDQTTFALNDNLTIIWIVQFDAN